MFQQVPTFLGIIFFITHSSTIGIDDKLDFGDSKSHPSVHRSRTHIPVSYKSAVTKIGINDHVDGTGVACGSGGCNKTSPDDIFETDVVVHIETKINSNQNVSEQIGYTPDVPVIIGFNSEPDDTNDEKPRHNQQSIYVPHPEPSAYGLDSPSSFSIPSTNQLFYPSHGDRRIEYGVPQDLPLSDAVNIKIKTLPNNFVDIENLAGMELAVPRFEPSQHTHHFGEVPPPQHAWYTKKASSFNPVEFKATKPVWRPTVWYKMAAPLRPTSSAECVCQNGQGHPQPGLRWYPSEGRRRVSDGNVEHFGNSGRDPGSQINDKLAPLN